MFVINEKDLAVLLYKVTKQVFSNLPNAPTSSSIFMRTSLNDIFMLVQYRFFT